MSLRPGSETVYGLVVAKVLENVGDGNDENELPDYVAASGTVVFTPQQTRTKTQNPSAFLRRSSVTCELGAEGDIMSPGAPSRVGVWLAGGVWEAQFRTGIGEEIPPLKFEVTAAHTAASPLNLAEVAPFVPGPGVQPVVLEIPAGGTPDSVLGWTENGLAWVPAGSGGGLGGQGAPGKSAYQLAVDGGYTGTVSQWLASLKGTPSEPDYSLVEDLLDAHIENPDPHPALDIPSLSLLFENGLI